MTTVQGKWSRWVSTTVLLVFYSGISFAENVDVNSTSRLSYEESVADILTSPQSTDGFYTVDEVSNKASQASSSESIHPFSVLQKFSEQVQQDIEQLGSKLPLLKFKFHSGRFGDFNEPYNRKKHFGSWITDRRPGSCMNIRGVVLERDSLVPIQKNAKGCTVLSGKWDDPYSGRFYTSAQDIQIDHLVPLKNAYISGGYRWSQKKRCLYYNFLGNDVHLLSVQGFENMSKGDKTPAGYMPPNPQYQCQFLKNWLTVKLIWNLEITSSEKEAVEELVERNRCDLKEISFSQKDLQAQRRFMQQNMNLCSHIRDVGLPIVE